MKAIPFVLSLLCAGAAFAQESAGAPSISQIYDRQFSMAERDFVPLVEAMPTDKFNFAPTNGEFTGVRTFAQQASHSAAVIYAVAAAALGEKNPTEMGEKENGPASLKTKEDVVKYVKDAFAYGHKAMKMLTDKNQTEMVNSAFGNNKVPRVAMANVAIWHTFDHYGQMVVYARMNGVVPPASRQ